MVGVIYVYFDKIFGFDGYFFHCLIRCYSMIVLSVLYARVLSSCSCTC